MIEPTGYTALDLIGFTDRGVYDPDAYYVKNDITSVGNTKWRCLIDDTHNITPTEGANWTIYLESATSLAGMDDVTLTSPKNGDGLVHDGNDWTNVPIMTKEQWKKNGAYNLLPQELYAPTTLSHNITWTVNTDGSVSTSNTTKDSTNESFVLFSRTLGYTVPAGQYKFCGKPSASKYRMQLQCTRGGVLTTLADLDYGITSAVVTIQEGDALQVALTVKSGETGGDTFYPMLTTDLSATNTDFTTPAKTNRDCMSYADNARLGAHNLFDNRFATTSLNGVTWWVNDDGSISISGTPSNNTYVTSSRMRPLPPGRYKLSGLKNTTNVCWAVLYLRDASGGIVKQFDINSKDDYVFDIIGYSYNYMDLDIKRITTGVACSGTAYPMITAIEDTCVTYQKPTKSNEQLSEKEFHRISVPSTYVPSGQTINLDFNRNNATVQLQKWGGSFLIPTRDVAYTLGTIPVSFRPKSIKYIEAHDTADYSKEIVIGVYPTGEVKIIGYRTADNATVNCNILATYIVDTIS